MTSARPVLDTEKFFEFCANLKVNTKERGEISLSKEDMLGTQIYFIEEVSKGLKEGIHDFIVLKGRQVAITTICLALDLYWLGKYGGISGAFVTQDEPTRDLFRTTFDQMLQSTPPKWRIRTKAHNRTQMVISGNPKIRRAENRIIYMVAGTRKNTKLGKGTANTFAHMTEVSEYGDEEGLASLEATFAQEHPHRLFIRESTAQGYNHFYASWEKAKRSKTQKAIFVGWWRNHLYRKRRGSQEHTVYWDGRMNPEERKWVREIKQLYDYDIDDEQIAWWRWMLAEKIEDDQLMFQNYPPTEHYAFVKTGSQFFSGARLNDEFKAALKLRPEMYRFLLNDNFELTELVKSNEKNQNLKIWDHPVPGGVYAIGADPAYGSSEWKDRFCVQVYRCYSDGMDQVAEFCTTQCNTAQFAWVVCYLGAVYLSQGNSFGVLNLELNGPGQAVWNEIQNLKRLSMMSQTDAGRKISFIVSRMQNFMYKRSDSFSGPSAFHTITTAKEKERMLNLFRDGFERKMITIKSPDCLDEMRHVIRDEGFLGAPDREKDDRVMASGLATTAWQDRLRARLMGMVPGGLTRTAAVERDKTAGDWEPTEIMNYIQSQLNG